MINRILIRIKVIQILYSFLLVEKKFTLESMPSQPTKEKRFAYALYLDMLVLLIKLARSVERRRGEYPLASTRFISRLLLDEQIRSLLGKYSAGDFPFDPIVEALAERVKESGVYKNFLKDSDKDIPTAEENVWNDLVNLVILQAPELRHLVEQRQNYTLKGAERMSDMLSRTLVNFLTSQDNVREVTAALNNSLDKARELYFRLLMLPVELTDLQARILDDNRHKFLKTEEDINPNLRFVENGLVEELRNNEMIQEYVEKNHISWMQEDPEMMRSLLKVITDSELYKEYMEANATDLHTDCELWKNLMRRVVLENTVFLESLEDKSVFWNDDLDIVATFVIKTFRKIEEGETVNAVLQQYKDQEDARFGTELIEYLYKNKETYRRYINDVLDAENWDAERLAFMDIVILETAITEILNFPKIPLSVSVNEYVEIAKSYSSHRSGSFVHGLLADVLHRLREEKILMKR